MFSGLLARRSDHEWVRPRRRLGGTARRTLLRDSGVKFCGFFSNVTVFSDYFSNLAIFPSEDLVATTFSDLDVFLKSFNNFCHFLNAL